jgi:hypothetical protein
MDLPPKLLMQELVTNYCLSFENFCPQNLFGVKQAFFDRTGEKYTSSLDLHKLMLAVAINILVPLRLQRYCRRSGRGKK